MIGNDVVDLQLAQIESNWQRRGFFDKIFTKNEQISIQKSVNHELEVWKLWSRKEAVYKIWNRETGIRKYNPIQFECFDLDAEIGKVRFENLIYFTKTEVTSKFVYTIGVSNIKNFEKIETLNRSVKIQKKNGIPFYINQNQEVILISKSHHGQFKKIIGLNSKSGF